MSKSIMSAIDLAALLLKNGADVNAKDELGQTPLFYAPIESVEGVKLLLQYGADVNVKDNKARTPLMKSAELGDIETTKFLLSAGADPNMKDDEGNTALSLAKAGDYKDVVRLLEKAGAKE